VVPEPVEQVQGESAIVRALFGDLDGSIGLPSGYASGEVAGKELAKDGADADAGEEVAPPADRVRFLFIKSIIWTIQGKLHEPGEGNCPALGDFAP
jgi:hypothetical protein